MATILITSSIFNTKIFPNSTTQVYQVVDMPAPNTFTYQGGWIPASGTRLADASPTTTQVVTYDSASGASKQAPLLNPISLGIFGQSTERSSVYATLYYTPSSASGDGTMATLSTSIANNLPIGAKLWVTVSGASPAAYNTSGQVLATVVGTWPNGQLQYPSAGVGVLTTPGAIAVDQRKTYPQCFGSLRRPAETVPIAPSVSVDTGSSWHRVMDTLHDAGYGARIVNGSIGSMSFCRHACGQVQSWNSSTHYRVARPAMGNGDAGCPGDFVIPGGTLLLMECTGGGDQVYAAYQGSNPITGGSARVYTLDYIYTVTGSTSGASAPTWANVTAVGQTITDGGLTWTCRSLNTTTDTDVTVKSITAVGQVLQEGQFGFDPLGLVARFRDEMARASIGCQRKIVVIENGQSDTAMTSTWYQNALTYLGVYFLKRGYTVVVGLSTFYPASNTTLYDKLATGLSGALSVLSSYWNGKVFPGPNLYALLGASHGQGGLYLESDNAHPLENVHHQGITSLTVGDLWSSAILSALTS